MGYTDPKTWVALSPLPAAELNTYLRDDLRALHDQGTDIVAANTIAPTLEFHKVTGATQINNITIAGQRRLLLWFTGAPLLKQANGGAGQLHLKSSADYQVTANEVLMFVNDGTDWYQVGAWGSASAFVGALVYHNADVAVTNSDVVLAMNSEDKDTNAFHDTATNNSRITIPGGLGGTYKIEGYAPIVTSAANPTMSISIRKNGSTLLAIGACGSASNTALQGSVLGLTLNVLWSGDLVATDYVELVAHGVSGSSTLGGRTGADVSRGVQFRAWKIS